MVITQNIILDFKPSQDFQVLFPFIFLDKNKGQMQEKKIMLRKLIN